MKKVIWLLICMFMVCKAYSQDKQNQSIEIKRNKKVSQNIEVEIVYNKNKDTKTSEADNKTRFLIKRKKDVDAKKLSLKKKKKTTPSKINKVEEVHNTVHNFYKVDKVPVFVNCNSNSERNQKKCFNIGISKHIQENFVYPEEAVENGIVGKVAIKFIINENGEVVNVNATDENKEDILTSYTVELISKLPKFKPAKKEGKPVAVYYEFHLDFSL